MTPPTTAEWHHTTSQQLWRGQTITCTTRASILCTRASGQLKEKVLKSLSHVCRSGVLISDTDPINEPKHPRSGMRMVLPGSLEWLYLQKLRSTKLTPQIRKRWMEPLRWYKKDAYDGEFTFDFICAPPSQHQLCPYLTTTDEFKRSMCMRDV